VSNTNSDHPATSLASASTVQLFRKRPVVIQAIQYTEALRDAHLFDGAPLPEGVYIPRRTLHPPTRKVWSADAYIDTLEGRMEVSLGDWIITGVKGERYACKPDIFAATYERADGGAVEAESERQRSNEHESGSSESAGGLQGSEKP
jgi:hypothetical protein